MNKDLMLDLLKVVSRNGKIYYIVLRDFLRIVEDILYYNKDGVIDTIEVDPDWLESFLNTYDDLHNIGMVDDSGVEYPESWNFAYKYPTAKDLEKIFKKNEEDVIKETIVEEKDSTINYEEVSVITHNFLKDLIAKDLLDSLLLPKNIVSNNNDLILFFEKNLKDLVFMRWTNEVDINVKLSDDIVPIHEDENKQYVKFDFNKLNGEKVFDMTFTVLIGMDFYSILDEIIIEIVK